MSYLLASFADIKKSDVILDPFCGSGSIPKTIIKYFNYNMCFSSDIEKSKVSLLKKEFKKNKKNLYISNLDALKLDKFEKALENTIGITMLSSFSTLVNGKKANVYHLIKE